MTNQPSATTDLAMMAGRCVRIIEDGARCPNNATHRCTITKGERWYLVDLCADHEEVPRPGSCVVYTARHHESEES